MPNGLIKNVKRKINFMRVGLSNVDTVLADPSNGHTSKSFGSGTDKQWTMLRFSTLLKLLNHTNVRF